MHRLPIIHIRLNNMNNYAHMQVPSAGVRENMVKMEKYQVLKIYTAKPPILIF